MTDNNMDCAGLMKRIDEKMEKGANVKLARFGITFAQMRVLMALYHMAEENVPLKSLERQFEVAQSTAAGLVTRLEGKGLVTSFSPSEDKRLKIVRLTEEGKKSAYLQKMTRRKVTGCCFRDWTKKNAFSFTDC